MWDSRAGRLLMVSGVVLGGDAGKAGRRGMSVLCGRSAWARMVSRTLRDEGGFGAGEPVGSRERFSFVDRMREQDAVMCPRAVAGLCG